MYPFGMPWSSPYWLVTVAGIVIAGVVLWRKCRPRRTYVIGQPMAQALKAEEARHSTRPAGKSPLPAGLRYDPSFGELDMGNPVRDRTDDELTAFCDRYAASNPRGRSQLRDDASLDDFYTLLSFSQRAAVFAMRKRGVSPIADGLAAIAAVEPHRIDYRDALVALSLLHHAARVVGANPRALFGKAASLAGAEMSQLILGFLKRSEHERDIQESWGYTAVETGRGPAFLQWGSELYQPTRPLHPLGLAVAELMKRDQYQPTSLTLASDLPAVWLGAVDDDLLKWARGLVRGVGTIEGRLRAQKSQDSRHQTLTIFLTESTDEAAASLLRLCEEKRKRPTDFVLAGAKEGPIFSLAVERSFVDGETPVESDADMQRFSKGMAELMRRHLDG